MKRLIISFLFIFQLGHSQAQMGNSIDGLTLDRMGSSVSLSSNGTRLAIGAIGDFMYNYNPKGRVMIYDWDGSSWSQLGDDINASTGNQFGKSVSLSSNGNRIAIGAIGVFDYPIAGYVNIYD